MASGSEVSLIIETGKRLREQGVSVRLVSFPSWELFNEQDQSYRDSVLPPQVELRLAVEAGVSQGWHRWTGPQGRVLGLDRFGASAPAGQVFKNLGFSVENILHIVADML
jgi:transketolase